MTMIDRILEKMDEKNYKKADLCRITGINTSTIYNIFDSKTNPNKIKINTIQAIAKALDTTVDFLVYGTIESVESSISIFEDMFEQLTTEGQKKAIDYINDLLQIYKK